VTAAVRSVSRQPRRAASAARRRRLYERRIRAARTDRDRLYVLVGWLMSEWHRLPAEIRTNPAADPLAKLARDLNGWSAGTRPVVTDRDGQPAGLIFTGGPPGGVSRSGRVTHARVRARRPSLPQLSYVT
jgi:hypothetical protein